MSDDYGDPPTCFSCTLRLNEIIHVKCAECPVRICMLCFQCGAESEPHKRGHNYELARPSENGLSNEWTYEDEFELLKAAHKFKMGNWGAIAESIGRKRSDGPYCKDYFEKKFVRGWIGQFSIKSANWEKLKYGMSMNQTLDTVLQKNCLESTERMLLIRDAIRQTGEVLDENDPKLAVKVQQLLEQYVQKCMNNEIEIKYDVPKILIGQYETELTPDPNDLDDGVDVKIRKTVKLEVQTDDSDIDDGPGPSCSTRRGGPPSSKKRKTTRVVRESSSDSDEKSDGSANEDGADRESDDEDQDTYETAQEFDTEDEKEDMKTKRGTQSSSRKRKRKRLCTSKKQRRLDDFRKMMNREAKKSEKKLKKLGEICSQEEVKELRSAFPRLLHESGVSKSDRPKIRPSVDLNILGYNIEREEFETEWFNEAEQLISRLSISAAPPQADEKLDMENDIKFARLRHYNRLLGIRKAKRNTVLEHDKINEFIKWYKEACMLSQNNSITEIMDSRSEKEKLLSMTQQFLTRDEYASLKNSIEKMNSTMGKIEKLQELQRNGDITLKNVPIERKKKKKMRKIDCEQQKRIHSEWNKTKKWHTEGFE